MKRLLCVVAATALVGACGSTSTVRTGDDGQQRFAVAFEALREVANAANSPAVFEFSTSETGTEVLSPRVVSRNEFVQLQLADISRVVDIPDGPQGIWAACVWDGGAHSGDYTGDALDFFKELCNDVGGCFMQCSAIIGYVPQGVRLERD